MLDLVKLLQKEKLVCQRVLPGGSNLLKIEIKFSTIFFKIMKILFIVYFLNFLSEDSENFLTIPGDGLQSISHQQLGGNFVVTFHTLKTKVSEKFQESIFWRQTCFFL
jgi:hypothetical protein